MIVDPLIVDDFIASLNVTVGATVGATPVAKFAGFVDATVGGVKSGAGPVAKIDENGDVSPLPDKSVTPETVIVWLVLNASADDGVNVAVFVAGL
jgi:hypothetical protein